VINLLVSPSFTFRDFRFLWLSSAFNSVGFIGEQVIVGWVILEITDSSFMVGVSLALRMVPFLFLGIIAGSLADRVNRRNLLMLVSVGMGFLSLSLAFIIYLGFIEVWIILLLTFLAGCVRAIGQPARQSFAYDIVGTANLVNAISNLSLGMRVGGIGGSLLAGLLVGKFGADAGYLVLSVSYFASVFIILFIRSPESPDLSEQESFWQNIAGVGKEIKRNNSLLVILLLSGMVEILGFSHQALLPVISRDVLGLGAEGLGVMNAMRSAGGILAVIILSSMGDIKRKGLLYLFVLYAFGVSLFLLAYAQSFLLAVFAIVVISGLGAISDILSQSLIQLVVPNELRGRAMGTWIFAVGLGPIGHMEIGAVAALTGVGLALTVHGGLLLFLAASTMIFFPRIRSL